MVSVTSPDDGSVASPDREVDAVDRRPTTVQRCSTTDVTTARPGITDAVPVSRAAGRLAASVRRDYRAVLMAERPDRSRWRHRGVRIGIAGCGDAAEALHLPALRRLHAEVTAVADPNRSARDRLAERFGVGRRHAHADGLIEDPEVDAVAVLTPPHVHAEPVIAALEAGKHVLVEKPLALDVAECDRMIDAAARHPSATVMVGFPLRFHRLVLRARDLINEGWLGAVTAIRTASLGPGTAGVAGRRPSSWRMARVTGGGTLFEMGVHHYDLWRFSLGLELEQVWTATEVEGESDRASVVTARLAGGVLGCAMIVRSLESSNEVIVHGSAGRVDADLYRFDGLAVRRAEVHSASPSARMATMFHTARELPRAARSLREGGEYALALIEQWRHFLGCVRDGRPVRSTLSDGREATLVARAVAESAQSGSGVSVHGEASRPSAPSHL
jgi:predicted dehydrogenase